MTPEREGRGPRRDKADPALRFDSKGREEPKAGSRSAGAWKKASARIRAAEAQPETAAPAPGAPGPEAQPPDTPIGEAPRPAGADPPIEGGIGSAPAEGALGQSVPKYRQRSRRADSAQPSASQGKYRQESQQARPADKLHHGGSSGTGAADGAPPEPELLRKSRLRMEKRETKLNKSREKLASQKPYKPPGPVRRAAGYARRGVHSFVHGKIYQVESENVGVEGAHRSELVGEAVGRRAVRFTKQRIRTRPARQVRRAEVRYGKAAADFRFQQAAAENPELSKNAWARFWRKHQQRRQYQKQAKAAAKQGARAAEKTAEKTGRAAVGFVRRHPLGVFIALLCLLLLVGLQSCMSSLSTIGGGLSGGVTATTYPAEEADLLGAEAAYAALEAELQNYLDTYTSTHDYDEYHFDLDDMEHDPYVLLSILSALHEGGWTLADVEDTLQALFDRQYILTEQVTVEIRYRTETRTDSEGNSYEVEVPYNYYICTVTLENTDLSHLPVYIMGEGQLSRYALYMASLGNRPDLFPGSAYVGKYTSPPTVYEVPPEALADETFAAMLTEAEKYIGYPYVWGGSSPATSFDCSGFVSWIVNHSGWDVGRLGATGLYNICTPVSAAGAKPGDLVFFVGTYDTDGISHCGLYVGDGWMIHAGDPIGYANLNSSYWQTHFYAYGRLP